MQMFKLNKIVMISNCRNSVKTKSTMNKYSSSYTVVLSIFISVEEMFETPDLETTL